MTKQLTILQWTNFKTQKCINPQCPTGQMFSTQVRARYYQLVFSNDKCCFGCNGYHTEHDRRRKMFNYSQTNKKQAVLIEYSSEYLIDFSCFRIQKAVKEVDNALGIKKKQIFKNTCNNLVEYFYHPVNYKSINCPFATKTSLDQKSSTNKGTCTYLYCPFLHQNEKLDLELNNFLDNQKIKLNKSKASMDSDPNLCKKKFDDKLLNLMLLRSCRSIEDLHKKEVNIIAKQDQISIMIDSNQPNESRDKKALLIAQDIQEIQKIKQVLKQKTEQCLKLDRQKQTQQKSRKVMDKNFSKDNLTKNKHIQQCQSDDLGVSYNYFKYGQKLSLIEGRTIEFKHFKDISDPNHIPLIMRYIAAFLNTEGGKLYIGIDDNSYAYGAKFKQTEYDKLLLKIDHEGKFYMTPPLMPQKYNIKLIPVYHDRKGEERWVIEIMVFPPKEQNKKLFLYNRECYMRMNASTHKLNASDIIELMSLNSENQSLEQVKPSVTLSQVTQIEKNKVATLIKDQNQQSESLKREKILSKRQNQLMSQNSAAPNTNSKSRQKFQTQQSKLNEFETTIKTKSVEDLYILRKEYEQKFKIIVEAYKKKQREMR